MPAFPRAETIDPISFRKSSLSAEGRAEKGTSELASNQYPLIRLTRS